MRLTRVAEAAHFVYGDVDRADSKEGDVRL